MTHPLLEALGGGEKKQERQNLPVPRFFRLKSTELPHGMEVRPGGHFKVTIAGKIKSIDDEGDIIVNVTTVNDNAPETEAVETPEIVVKSDQAVSP